MGAVSPESKKKPETGQSFTVEKMGIVRGQNVDCEPHQEVGCKRPKCGDQTWNEERSNGVRDPTCVLGLGVRGKQKGTGNTSRDSHPAQPLKSMKDTPPK